MPSLSRIGGLFNACKDLLFLSVCFFYLQIGLRGQQYFGAASQLSERLALAGYACAATTALDTLCALVPPPHQPMPSRATVNAAAASSSLTAEAGSSQEVSEVNDEYVPVPQAVAALAGALAPEACTGGMSTAAEVSARAPTVSIPVDVTRFGGELERLEVTMATSSKYPVLQEAQQAAPWLWASSSQWLACLGLGLDLRPCNELRDAWCHALRGEPYLST